MINNKSIPNSNKKRIAYLSTYPPRECGIATFAKDLVDSIEGLQAFKPPVLISVNDKEVYDYDKRVKWLIERDESESYLEVAEQINASDVDVVNLQHEFGLFGGEYGEYILQFLDVIEKPVVTTLHTVLERFDPGTLCVLKKVVSKSAAVVVIANVALKVLASQNVIPKRKAVIPHGCPQINFVSRREAKEALGLKGCFVLTTFGLLSSNKGIEYAIQALPQALRKKPNLVYLIIGETHPQVRKNEGESYRNKLLKLVKDLNLEEHVLFQNRFLTKRELIKFLQATDIYITPYVSANQISSGTLAYALGAGSAVISTPYLHAQENLADNRGLFSEFRNPRSIADCIEQLLDDEVRETMERKNYEYSRRFIWSNVAQEYAKVFNLVSAEPKMVGNKIGRKAFGIAVPEPFIH